MFFDFLVYQKFKGGTLIKYLISMLPNLTETLHSKAKLKNKQVAKIWDLVTQSGFQNVWKILLLIEQLGNTFSPESEGR